MSGKDAAHLKSFYRALDRTHRLILLMFYVDRLTATEIGSVLNLSEEQVRDSIEQLRLQARSFVEPLTPVG